MEKGECVGGAKPATGRNPAPSRGLAAAILETPETPEDPLPLTTMPVIAHPGLSRRRFGVALALAPGLAWAQQGDSAGPGATLPPRAHMVFDVDGQDQGRRYTARATLDWTALDGRYEASMSVQALMIEWRRQSSRGTLGPDGLRPQTFVDRSRRDRIYRLDWEHGAISGPQGPVPVPLREGTQDRLSVFFELARRLQRGGASAPLGLPVLASRTVEDWTFRSLGASQLDLPAGRTDVVHLQRITDQQATQQVDLWMAPGLGHLPVRIRLTEPDGSVVDQRWRGGA